MIDFEEELRKYHPSIEVDSAEDAIKNHDMSDMTDLLIAMLQMPAAAPEQPPVDMEMEEEI